MWFLKILFCSFIVLFMVSFLRFKENPEPFLLWFILAGFLGMAFTMWGILFLGDKRLHEKLRDARLQDE